VSLREATAPALLSAAVLHQLGLVSSCPLIQCSPAPELTARLRHRGRVNVWDRVRLEVRVRVSINKNNSGAGELTDKYCVVTYSSSNERVPTCATESRDKNWVGLRAVQLPINSSLAAPSHWWHLMRWRCQTRVD